MRLRVLLDENIPIQLQKVLQAHGHDVACATAASADAELASRARREKRILITLDSDFTNRLLYPPTEMTVIHLRIHPPKKEWLVEAVTRLLESSKELRGLVIVERTGPLRVIE